MTIPPQKSEPNGAALAPLRVELAPRVRAALAEFGYSGDVIGATVAEARMPNLPVEAQEALFAKLEPTTPAACLVRAFGLRLPTREEDLRQQLGADFFALCEEAGLWERIPGGVTGTVGMVSHGDCFVLSDHELMEGESGGEHWVMGIGTSSGQVAQSVIRRPYERVLDLCCGSGIQSFLLQGSAKEFVAVDRNARALNLGRFGAAMNGYTNIDFRESDCYSAVAGETFDAIICNPPFAISPGRTKMYRDGGMRGDDFARRVITEAPEYLREGGFAFFVCDVAAVGPASSEARLREWVAGQNCDVVAIAGEPTSAASYATAWVGGDAAEVAEWAAFLAETGVESVSNWNVVLRKRSCGGENWFRSEERPKGMNGFFADQIARRFRSQDLLRQGEVTLWAARLRVAPEVRVERTARAVEGRWVTESAKVIVTRGLTATSMLDPRTVDFFPLFDGVNTMEAILGRVAVAMGVPTERLRGGWRKYVSQLTAEGVLEDRSDD